MFPERRMRRIRRRAIQPLVRETRITKEDLIAPLFIDENAREPIPIASMPGQFRYPIQSVGTIAQRLRDVGIRAVILFGIPEIKDAEASGAYAEEGVIQQAVRAIRAVVPDMVIITDLCACEYTDHGHCGIILKEGSETEPDNDASLELMQKIAISQAMSGADIVAPSCMLDGMVTSIRDALDRAGFYEVSIMSYSTKFASALYGPFRDAADSGSFSGDRTTYQMDVANKKEAFLESELDATEGADFLMVKPGGWFLDIVRDITELGLPLVVYQVSGEYAMIRAAAQNGWLDEKKTVIESLICIKRAGASLIITYFAEDVCRWLDEVRNNADE